MARSKRGVARPRRQAELLTDSESETAEVEETQLETIPDENKTSEADKKEETIPNENKVCEGDKKEEIQPVAETDASDDAEEKTRRKRLEIAKGKMPMEPGQDNSSSDSDWKFVDFDDPMFDIHSNKSVVIKDPEETPKSETGEAKILDTEKAQTLETGEAKKPAAGEAKKLENGEAKKSENEKAKKSDNGEAKKSGTESIVVPKAKRSKSTRRVAFQRSYTLRSGTIEMGVKRKREEEENTEVMEAHTEKTCKRIKKERDNDDGTDDNEGAAGGAHKNRTSPRFKVVAGK